MSALASLGLSLANQFVGPAVSNVLNGSRLQANYNAPAISKYLQYWSNYLSCSPNIGAYQADLAGFNFAGDNYAPLKMSGEQLITRFNQFDWSRAYDNQAASDRVWRWLQKRLRWNGIDMAVPLNEGANGTPTQGTTQEQLEWMRLIEMQCPGAGIDKVLRDYWRSRIAIPEQPAVTDAELKYNLSRAQFRRKHDRDRILSPFYNWSPADALRLQWLGVIDQEEFTSIVNAAGIVRSRDASLFSVVSRPTPSVETLQDWSVRRLWDNEIAGRYELDAGREQSPVAQFFMRGSGAGVAQPDLPGQPPGSADWAALGYRATRQLPDFGLAVALQHRLRPEEGSLDVSSVPGVKPWTEADTRNMLKVAGYTDPVIEQMLALVAQPINVRIINTVLLEALKHADVRNAANEAFGAGVDWVKQSYLDHGFTEAVATLAARGIEAKANDEANAEKLEHEKRLRQENRQSYLLQYELGLAGESETVAGMTDKFYDADMARQEVAIVKAKLDAGIKKSALKALEEAWITGKMTAQDIRGFLDGLGFTSEAKERYIGEWTWERTEKTRLLSTGEILQALKEGLLAPAVAQFRLVNLGWSAPDALIEIAQVQHGLAMAASKSAAATAAHQAAIAAKAHSEAMKEAKDIATKMAVEYKEKLATEKQVQRAAHERLLATSEYYAKSHLQNDAYNKAHAKGDTEKMDAELNKNISAYQKYLLDQIKLIQEGSEVANVIGPIDTHIAPTSESSAGASPPAGAAKPATTTTPSEASGAGGAVGP